MIIFWASSQNKLQIFHMVTRCMSNRIDFFYFDALSFHKPTFASCIFIECRTVQFKIPVKVFYLRLSLSSTFTTSSTPKFLISPLLRHTEILTMFRELLLHIKVICRAFSFRLMRTNFISVLGPTIDLLKSK